MYDTSEEEFPRAFLDKLKKLRGGTLGYKERKKRKYKIGTLH